MDGGSIPERSFPPDAGLTLLRPADFTRGRLELVFPDLAPDEVVVIAPVHADQGEVEDLTYSLSASGISGSPLPPRQSQQRLQRSVSTRLDGLLPSMRERHVSELERDLRRAQQLERGGAGGSRPASAATLAAAPGACAAPYIVGERQCTFWVLAAGEELQVTATLRHESASTLWFIADEDVTAFSEAEFEALVEPFERAAPTVQRYFGEPSDVDANGKVIVLFTRRIAPYMLGTATPSDLYPEAEALRVIGWHSNEAEIIYVATWHSSWSRADYLRWLPMALVHELKHLISYGRRFTVGAPFEESWMEEASAVAAEELLGLGSQMGHPQSFSHESFSQPQDYRVAQHRWPTHCKRDWYGFDFLFGWRVAEGRGQEAFWLPWTRGPRTGIANLEDHAGQRMPELMLDWAAALLLDHREVVPGLNYATLNLQDESWPALGTLPLEDGTASGNACSIAYHVGRGRGTDARATLRVTNDAAPHALVLRVRWPAFPAQEAASPSSPLGP